MPKLKETDEASEKLEETKDINLPQETVPPQQETQTLQETTVSKDSIATALKKEAPTETEVTAPQQETQTPQETTVTTDDIADALKKTNITDDVSPRRPLKTDYPTVLWGKAADEVNQESNDINQFVQELEQKGLTPEQYRAQKLAEYSALDDPIRKEGQEPQATSVPKDSIAAALKKEVPAKTEVPALQQEVQAPQETTIAKGDIAAALKKEVPTQTEVHVPQQQEVQAPQETTIAKGDIAAALKREVPTQTEVAPPQQEVQVPQETTVAKGDIVAALKKETPAKKEGAPVQPEVQTQQETTIPTDGAANAKLVKGFFQEIEKKLNEEDLEFTSKEISPLLKQIDTNIMAEAVGSLEIEDIDLVNEFALMVEKSIEYGDDRNSAELIQDFITEYMKARDIPGLRDTIENLFRWDKDNVSESDWRGYRFELQYAAAHASEIAGMQMDEGNNFIDVKMKDGTYRELKSFSNYSSANANIMHQLLLDVRDRGAKNITVVLDKTFPPPPGFVEKLQEKINNGLAKEYSAVINISVE